MTGRDSILGEERRSREDVEDAPETVAEDENDNQSETTERPDRDQSETNDGSDETNERVEFSQRTPRELLDRVEAAKEDVESEYPVDFPSRNAFVNYVLRTWVEDHEEHAE